MANPAPVRIADPAAVNSRGVIDDGVEAGYLLKYSQPSTDNQWHPELGLEQPTNPTTLFFNAFLNVRDFRTYVCFGPHALQNALRLHHL